MTHLFVPSRSLAMCSIAVALSSSVASPLYAQDRQVVGGREVAIYNVAGHVRVEAGSGSEVTVEMTRGGRDGAKLKTAIGEIRGRNAYRVLYPTDDDIVYGGDRTDRAGSSTDLRIDRDGTWDGGDRNGNRGDRVRVTTRGDGTDAWADLVVRVPAGTTVSVYLGLGELTATRVDADLRLDVSAARVVATGTRGRLDIDAGSGGVEVREVRGSELKIDNGSGGVTMTDVHSDTCTIDTGSGSVGGTGVQCGVLRVDVGSGTVRFDEIRSTDVAVDAGSGGVHLGFVSSPKSLSVESGSGSVAVALPAGVDATVDIETGSGGISSDFPVRTNSVQRDRLRGTIGDGSGRIRIETGSGSVRLRRNPN
ncbi:MAG: DUF4097 family beta strand repeat protein [Gemmatimonadaceae bacterium]|nr:DUF4097 family beta strand repeat protein [Gemmatimonadaceae bacterium]